MAMQHQGSGAKPATRVWPVAAGAGSYFAVGLLLGSVLGVIRVLLVSPIAGEFLSVLIELPVMLLLCWLTVRKIAQWLSISAPGSLLAVGLSAFLLLQVAETLLAGFIGPLDFAGNATRYWQVTTPARIIGFLGQVAYAFLPLALHRKSR